MELHKKDGIKKMDRKMFFDDNFKGIAKGGLYVRNDLFKFFKKLSADGIRPVGIVIEDGWDLEIITEVKEDENKINE